VVYQNNKKQSKGNDVQNNNNTLDRNNTVGTAATTTSSSTTQQKQPKTTLVETTNKSSKSKSSFSWIYVLLGSLLLIAVLLYLFQQTQLQSYLVQSRWKPQQLLSSSLSQSHSPYKYYYYLFKSTSIITDIQHAWCTPLHHRCVCITSSSSQLYLIHSKPLWNPSTDLLPPHSLSFSVFC